MANFSTNDADVDITIIEAVTKLNYCQLRKLKRIAIEQMNYIFNELPPAECRKLLQVMNHV